MTDEAKTAAPGSHGEEVKPERYEGRSIQFNFLTSENNPNGPPKVQVQWFSYHGDVMKLLDHIGHVKEFDFTGLMVGIALRKKELEASMEKRGREREERHKFVTSTTKELGGGFPGMIKAWVRHCCSCRTHASSCLYELLRHTTGLRFDKAKVHAYVEFAKMLDHATMNRLVDHLLEVVRFEEASALRSWNIAFERCRNVKKCTHAERRMEDPEELTEMVFHGCQNCNERHGLFGRAASAYLGIPVSEVATGIASIWEDLPEDPQNVVDFIEAFQALREMMD